MILEIVYDRKTFQEKSRQIIPGPEPDERDLIRHLANTYEKLLKETDENYAKENH